MSKDFFNVSSAASEAVSTGVTALSNIEAKDDINTATLIKVIFKDLSEFFKENASLTESDEAIFLGMQNDFKMIKLLRNSAGKKIGFNFKETVEEIIKNQSEALKAIEEGNIEKYKEIRNKQVKMLNTVLSDNYFNRNKKATIFTNILKASFQTELILEDTITLPTTTKNTILTGLTKGLAVSNLFNHRSLLKEADYLKGVKVPYSVRFFNFLSEQVADLVSEFKDSSPPEKLVTGLFVAALSVPALPVILGGSVALGLLMGFDKLAEKFKVFGAIKKFIASPLFAGGLAVGGLIFGLQTALVAGAAVAIAANPFTFWAVIALIAASVIVLGVVTAIKTAQHMRNQDLGLQHDMVSRSLGHGLNIEQKLEKLKQTNPDLAKKLSDEFAAVKDDISKGIEQSKSSFLTSGAKGFWKNLRDYLLGFDTLSAIFTIIQGIFAGTQVAANPAVVAVPVANTVSSIASGTLQRDSADYKRAMLRTEIELLTKEILNAKDKGLISMESAKEMFQKLYAFERYTDEKRQNPHTTKTFINFYEEAQKSMTITTSKDLSAGAKAREFFKVMLNAQDEFQTHDASVASLSLNALANKQYKGAGEPDVQAGATTTKSLTVQTPDKPKSRIDSKGTFLVQQIGSEVQTNASQKNTTQPNIDEKKAAELVTKENNAAEAASSVRKQLYQRKAAVSFTENETARKQVGIASSPPTPTP